jgi:hypothetical protein
MTRRRHRRRRDVRLAAQAIGRVVAAAALIASAPMRSARADLPRDTPTAIEVDRDMAPGGRIGLGFDGGEPVDAWGASIALGWLERPIALDAGAFGGGSPATRPVRRRETLALGGALAVGSSVVVDAVLRASHQIGARLTAAGNPDGLARYVLHDLRLGVRIQIAGDRDRAALLRGELTLPSGDDAQFAGDAAWTAAWCLIGRASLPYGIAVAANAGIRLHGAEVAVGDRLIGDELFAALGGTLPVSALGLGAADRVALSAALLGSLGDDIGDASGPRPVEARLGAIVRARPELTLGAHIGFGLDDQIGAPRFRALVELAWTPRVERPEPGRAPPPPADDDDDEP